MCHLVPLSSFLRLSARAKRKVTLRVIILSQGLTKAACKGGSHRGSKNQIHIPACRMTLSSETLPLKTFEQHFKFSIRGYIHALQANKTHCRSYSLTGQSSYCENMMSTTAEKEQGEGATPPVMKASTLA